MKKFTIHYIDGHDLRYKTFKTIAANDADAVGALWAKYEPFDFDHQIIEIVEEEPTR
jgi:hypothetical protein